MARRVVPPDSSIHQLKVTILGLAPAIWRRFQVESNTSLHRLHRVLQAVMGWQDYHLYQFTANGIEYGEPDPFDELDFMSSRTARLSGIAPTGGSRFLYVYDFGDGWQHEILVEKIMAPVPEVRYPICLAGKRACPREDAGGIQGYAEMLVIRRHPRHEEYEETMQWLGKGFDPAAFDLEAVNRRLRRIRPLSGGKPARNPGHEGTAMPLETAPGIAVDPEVRLGKPAIRGSRGPAPRVIAKLAGGMAPGEVAEE